MERLSSLKSLGTVVKVLAISPKKVKERIQSLAQSKSLRL